VFSVLNSGNVSIALRERGSELWTETQGKDTIGVNGLKECTVYEYTYRVICGDTFSEKSTIDTVKTACKNNVVEVESQIRIVPNPTSDYINIYTSSSTLLISGYRLINTSGMVVFRNDSKVNTEYIKIDMQKIPPGIYLLELFNSNGIKTVKKIVKV